jgi:solute carrier family 35 protein E1
LTVVNKKLLNVVPAPLVIGSIQLGIGSLYVGLLWLLRLRSMPTLTTPQAILQFRNVGFWHALGQQASMVSLGAGPVSFTHIVKALEPFFSAVVSAMAFGKWMPLPVYATLLPVVGGVGYACLKESAFSWLAFGAAMVSNLAFAWRAVLSKVAMGTALTSGTNLTSPNVFAVVTVFAFLFSIPMAIFGEGALFQDVWSKALRTTTQKQLIRSIFISGLFHYLNNEVMYLALGNVHPVTLAVGNTMKRVFIMVASVMVFRNQISMQAGIGSAVGISGVLLYSLVKQHYERQDVVVTKDKAKLSSAKQRVPFQRVLNKRF